MILNNKLSKIEIIIHDKIFDGKIFLSYDKNIIIWYLYLILNKNLI